MRGERVREDKSGAWNQQVETVIYKIDEQQGPTVQHRELYSVHYNNLGKTVKRIHTYTCVTESLCCTPETNTL